ncbi:MAG TPA: phosphohistidine phosphatase SixA [Candidatus Methylomirabilis sp.]|nr:phosphohistidine phosphatase SixA [Candidatus Methylomirabilis sp.]
MPVYLVQHGEAKPETEDPSRPLTDCGREGVQRVARHAAALKLPVSEIRHSGKLRARQTAEILAAALAPGRGVRQMDSLAPGDDPAKARVVVESAVEPLMLVGHLPHLSRLASMLLVGDPERHIIQFRNGGIVCLVKSEGGWLLQWVLTPELAGP